jgi:hypothetical protein
MSTPDLTWEWISAQLDLLVFFGFGVAVAVGAFIGWIICLATMQDRINRAIADAYRWIGEPRTRPKLRR